MARHNDILQELMENAPELALIPPVMPYKVPAGYFDDLPGLILMRIRTMNAMSPGEELQVISPLLAGLKKEMPYSVPPDYFETLVPHEQKKEQAPVRSISFPKRVLRYAAAAAVAGIIALTVWFTTDRSPVTDSTMLAQNDSVAAKDISNISDVEIENYLDGNIGVINYEPSVSADDIKAEDVRLMLAEISDTELETYLN
jgi:hypothetical protein